MRETGFEQAWQYALDRLERELSPKFHYHSLPHTRDDVVEAVKRLALLEGIQGQDWSLLLTAAYYHDTGFCLLEEARYQDNQHESLSIELAAQALPGFGFSQAQIQIIAGIIRATHLPQNPQTLLEAIMADADLDPLGRVDFWERSGALREEQAAFGLIFTDLEWYRLQDGFLTTHRYFTQAARGFRDAQKKNNLDDVRRRLAALKGKSD
jgi:predicted metal-dependent HD superfamily phosphohydrolase